MTQVAFRSLAYTGLFMFIVNGGLHEVFTMPGVPATVLLAKADNVMLL